MNKIPYKPRYERTLKLALEFIMKEQINALPLDAIRILEKYVVSINTVGEISEKLCIPRRKVISGKDADIFFYNGKYKVVYNEYIASSARINWTFMHELGHIYLGHLTDFEQASVSKDDLDDNEYQVLEREANFFASEVLVPQIILNHLGIHYWGYIETMCGISEEAAKIQAKKLKSHYYTNIYSKFTPDVLKQFENFLSTARPYSKVKKIKRL